jgi:hypothetical protein
VLKVAPSGVGDNRSFERRINRLPLPPCSACHTTTHLRVVSRTDYVLYVRCGHCLEVWSLPKPDVRQMGS